MADENDWPDSLIPIIEEFSDCFDSMDRYELLFDYAKKLAKKNACTSIGLDAFTYNHAAHKFFFKEDFIVKGYHFVHVLDENKL